MTETVRVLMVCTGNICRSPMAEAVLRRKVADAGLDKAVEIDSAGTVDYHAGSPPDHRAQALGERRGYDLSRLRARRIRPVDFERFDLLLVMERDHVERLVELCPKERVDRVRLLMDFAPGIPPGTEVPDPYYGAPAGFERVLEMVEQACAGLLPEIQRRLQDRA